MTNAEKKKKTLRKIAKARETHLNIPPSTHLTREEYDKKYPGMHADWNITRKMRGYGDRDAREFWGLDATNYKTYPKEEAMKKVKAKKVNKVKKVRYTK